MRPLYRTDWHTRGANITLILAILFLAVRFLPVILHNLSAWWITQWH